MIKKQLQPYEGLYPEPTVLVTCQGQDGKNNIITIAWAGVICSSPPTISISIRPSRYSYGIIKQSGEFVVNIPSQDRINETDYCGMVSGRDVDKFKVTRFTAIAASVVSAPLIKECPVNIECKVKDIVELGAHHMFIAEVVAINADSSVLSKSAEIDYSKARPITYNQGEYWSLGKKLGVYGMSEGRLKSCEDSQM